MTDTKVCCDCKVELNRSEFHRNASTPDGLSYICRACTAVRHRERYARNRDAILSRNNAWREANREADLAAKRRWYQSNKAEAAARGRVNRLRTRYGLTEDDYDSMRTRQGGVCAICGRPGDGPLHVDHDHATGAVRGLLCSPCNRGIGHLGDDPLVALAATAYLIKHALLTGERP